MAFADEKEGRRRKESEPDKAKDNPQEGSSRSRKRPPLPELGHALRSAYEEAVNEDIPSEMLDLLGKLG